MSEQESFAKNLDVTMDSQKSSGKVYRLSDVAEHNAADDLWIAIHNKVYDVTKFQEEHPGGVEVLLEHAGTEGTYAFEDVGHSLDARDLLAQYYIGDLHEDDRSEKAVTTNAPDESQGMSMGVIMGVGAVIVAAVSIFFLNKA